MPTRKILNIGAFANDGTGDTLRDAADKINYNFFHLFDRFKSQNVSGATTIDDSVGIIILTNAGFTVTIEDGSDLGLSKIIVNNGGASVDFSGTFLTGTTLTVANSAACQLIWTGQAWALISDAGISIT